MSGSQMLLNQLLKNLGVKIEPAQVQQLVEGIMAMVPQFQADYVAIRTQAPAYLQDVLRRLERIERKLDETRLEENHMLLEAATNGR